jgi:oxygen-dependent protoporphyrinogen oxidase
MIGTLNTNNREVTIIGAGIAGMLAAYSLAKNGYVVTLLEEKERAGGLLRTRQTPFGIAEAAANSLLASPAVKDLCDELGIDLVPVRKEAKARYILRGGILRKFPLTIFETLATLGRAAFSRASNQIESMDLGAWGQRHLGPAAVEYLLTPFVRGIYGVQPQEVGVAAAMPKLIVPQGQTLLSSMVRKTMQRSQAKTEKAGMVAPKGGMSDLVNRLEHKLQRQLGTRFKRGVRIDALPDAANVVICTPAYRAADLVETKSPELARSLRAVQYTPMVSVTAFVDRAALTRPISGVGVLVPASEKRKSLGILFSSSAFAGRVTDEERFASFTLMMGGTADRDWVNATDEEIKEAVKQELTQVLGLRRPPLEIVINRWPQAIPRYSTELPAVWQCAKETWCATPGRLLFGNYTGQVSMRGMIESAAALK